MKPVGAGFRWLAAALYAVLCACATPPKGEAQHAAIADSGLGLAGAAAPPAPEAWWQGFDDAQLDRLIQQALSDNPGLAQAGARLRLAEAQAAAAHAGQLPGVKLSAGETRLKIPEGFPQALAGGQTVWLGDLGAMLSWDLDLWGEREDTVVQTRALAKAATLDIDNARLLLSGALVQSYIDLSHSYALADIAERAEAQRANILEITRKRVAAGLDTRVELREAEGALPQARLALTQAQSAQALAIHQLAALGGRGADAYAAIGRPQLNLDAALPLPAELPVNLLARRPDVIAARSRIEAADAGKRAAKAAFYPNVNLTALAGFASFSLSDLLGANSFGYGAGPGLSLPLFDGGRLRAQYRGTEAALDQAVADYDDTVVRAVHQAADQLSLIDSLSAELEQQRQSLDAAEEAYRLAEERYRAGLAGYLTVLNAETEVLNERRQRVDLSASLALARVTLLLAVGGSFRYPAAQSVAAR
ncbi:MAG: efflux transporter outer membrane subunit [Steroidobacteraceae bacterium]|jgi:NodT family efflux transporter outer membrane factor (OMF) lipoprotein